MSPAKKRALSIEFSRAFSWASTTARSTSSTPHTSPAAVASAIAIVPIPQKRSKTRSRPVRPASSAAAPYRRSAISVLVWKKASGEIRKRSRAPRASISSSIASSPRSWTVSPSRVVSDTSPVRVQRKLSAAAASASSAARKSPALVTTRACS